MHEANITGGFGAELVAWACEHCFDELDAPPKRLGVPDTRIPAAPVLQEALLPSAATIASEARQIIDQCSFGATNAQTGRT